MKDFMKVSPEARVSPYCFALCTEYPTPFFTCGLRWGVKIIEGGLKVRGNSYMGVVYRREEGVSTAFH